MDAVESHVLNKTGRERSDFQAGILISEIHPAFDTQGSLLLRLLEDAVQCPRG
jgi:hypothetical protein